MIRCPSNHTQYQLSLNYTISTYVLSLISAAPMSPFFFFLIQTLPAMIERMDFPLVFVVVFSSFCFVYSQSSFRSSFANTTQENDGKSNYTLRIRNVRPLTPRIVIPQTTATSSTFTYTGCFIDNTNTVRVLPNELYDGQSSYLSCFDQAISSGYAYVGFEWWNSQQGSGQCWGGNSLTTAESQGTASSCTQITSASSTVMWAGANAIALYSLIVPSALYVGCYVDNTNTVRVLPNQLYSAQSSYKSCFIQAQLKGYAYVGFEWWDGSAQTGQCWAGNSLTTAESQGTASSCTQVATAGGNAIWAGANAIALYSLSSPSCPAGSYSPIAVGSIYSSSCTQCTKGTFSSVGSTSCQQCPAGSLSASDGATQCASCSAGSFSGVGASACAQCSINSYSSTAGSTTCQQCLTVGSYTTAVGATSCLYWPTSQPSRQPSRQPVNSPTSRPSRKPTGQPTSHPSSSKPTYRPTVRPSTPTYQPTSRPTSSPSINAQSFAPIPVNQQQPNMSISIIQVSQCLGYSLASHQR